jgi:hypothetical protein
MLGSPIRKFRELAEHLTEDGELNAPTLLDRCRLSPA